MVQWLALLLHSKRPTGALLCGVCMESACSPSACVGFLRIRVQGVPRLQHLGDPLRINRIDNGMEFSSCGPTLQNVSTANMFRTLFYFSKQKYIV